MEKEFTCEHCGGTFIEGWTDEERDEEYKENFPGNEEERVLVCDVCFEELMTKFRKEGWVR